MSATPRDGVREALKTAWDEQCSTTFEELADTAIDAVFPIEAHYREPIEGVIAKSIARSPIDVIYEARFDIARVVFAALRGHYTEGRGACHSCGAAVQWHPGSDDFGVCSGCGMEHS